MSPFSRVPKSTWLYSEEYSEVVQRLVELGLIKWSNKRNLPLKKGGFTDVYINLRDARNNPASTAYLAELFKIPLQRLQSSCFAEVPDAVSGIAGYLSVISGIPYITIREKPKEGRVAKATVIGRVGNGTAVDILDDVITDGESKIAPYREVLTQGMVPRSLIMLVDRQQGWREKFAEEKVDIPVWPGMTLHDVRKALIDLGHMRRCTPEAEAANKVIVALDGKTFEAYLPLVDELRTTGVILKVNDMVFGDGIEHLLPRLSVYGRVMVDLKSHDIPNTIANVCGRLRRHEPWAVTVHASGGAAMVRAAKEALEGSGTFVLGITVLTSIDPETCDVIYHRQPMEQVQNLAKVAMDAGADGLVCSPEETAMLRRLYPDAFIVNPGVRSEGVDAGDQKRISTPEGAIKNGANYVVMGREITGSSDPAGTYHTISERISNMRNA